PAQSGSAVRPPIATSRPPSGAAPTPAQLAYERANSPVALDGSEGVPGQNGVPVVIHCGSGPAPGDFTGPDPIAKLLGRYPRLPLIVAHMGMPEYSAFLDLAERYDDVRLDTTM